MRWLARGSVFRPIGCIMQYNKHSEFPYHMQIWTFFLYGNAAFAPWSPLNLGQHQFLWYWLLMSVQKSKLELVTLEERVAAMYHIYSLTSLLTYLKPCMRNAIVYCTIRECYIIFVCYVSFMVFIWVYYCILNQLQLLLCMYIYSYVRSIYARFEVCISQGRASLLTELNNNIARGNHLWTKYIS